MNAEITSLLKTVFCGTVAGFSFGMTAGGGSVLAVPLLIYAVRLPPHKAVCVSMMTISALALLATVQRLRDRQIDVFAGIIIAVSGIVAAPFGAWLNRRISETALLVLFSLIMIFVAGRMILNHANTDQAKKCFFDQAKYSSRSDVDGRGSLILTFIGLVTGTVAGLLGVGGGFIIVPALVLLERQEISRAISTAFLSITLIGLSATTSHFIAGQRVPLTTTCFFVASGIIGLKLGLWFGQRISTKVLQNVFAIVIFFVAVTMLSQGLR